MKKIAMNMYGFDKANLIDRRCIFGYSESGKINCSKERIENLIKKGVGEGSVGDQYRSIFIIKGT